MRPITTPDPEDKDVLKDKHPHYIAGWNKVKHPNGKPTKTPHRTTKPRHPLTPTK